jgi:2-polyprenyl-6-methoxyphenol hydroxylase-like FAD-dependent oxidoreductase
MHASSSSDTDVLIVGAGPTGLVLALWLTRLGVRVRIIDKAPEPGTTSRAIAVQARTLELYREIGIADEVIERGLKMRAANLWTAGKRAARVVFGDIGAGLSPYPFALIFPQDEHEELLIEHLAHVGVDVERRTELLGFDDAGRVRARLKRSDGTEDTCEAAYLAGCDGIHSTVRDALQIGFAGGTYAHLFYVADVDASGAVMNGEIHAALDKTDFLVVFPLKGEGHARLIGTVRDEFECQHEQLSWNDVSQQVMQWMRIEVRHVHWFSTYRVHHRIATHFRKEHAFIVGDAAHVHSPVGGQGMNTGIGDAANLVWKLAAVLHGRADAAVLDSYESERIAFAHRLVATTDQAFTGVTSRGAIPRWLRLDIAPRVLPALFRIPSVRRFMFRTVSQTAVRYRASALSEGSAGDVHGGDRLPWVPPPNGLEEDNFSPLTSLDWQVHVYGDAGPEIRELCHARKLNLHIFPWRTEMGGTGLLRDAVYLVRPDGYVALANREGRATAITSYLDAHGFESFHRARPRPYQSPRSS